MKTKYINQAELARIKNAMDALEDAQEISHSRDVDLPVYVNELKNAINALICKTCVIQYDEAIDSQATEAVER